MNKSNSSKPDVYPVVLLSMLLAMFCVTCHVGAIESTDHPVIRYCVDPNWMPYEGIENGQHVGISADYLDLISEASGLKFKLVVTQSWNESLELLKSGECQLSPLLNQTKERDKYLIFSEHYFESPNVLVSLREQPFLQGFENVGNRRLALPENYRITEYVKEYYPDVKFVLVDNEHQGLNWVLHKKVDLFVGSLLSVNYHIYESEMWDLKVAGWVGAEDNLKIAVVHEIQPVLEIINLALSQISEKQHIEIIKRWSNVQVVEHQNYRVAWQVLIVALFIITLILFRNRTIGRFNQQLQLKNTELQRLRISLEQSNQELEYLSHHDPLTKLYNRNYFHKTVSEDLRNLKTGSVCLIILDIDHFKKINDNHGHQIGDEILKSLSLILHGIIRQQDIAARWGGEEFVIICYQSAIEDAKRLCGRIASKIREFQFPAVKNLTCSFGIAQLKSDESIMGCFERADKALYRAKEQGRNQICHIE